MKIFFTIALTFLLSVSFAFSQTNDLRNSAFNINTSNALISHATDCTSVTAVEDVRCYEVDSNRIFVCEPTAGDCDTAGEWKQIAYLGSIGGTLTGILNLDDVALTFEEGVDTLTITAPALTAARAVTLGDFAGEISVLGQGISNTELDSTYSGVGSCTNQFVRAVNDNAVPTCATVADTDLVTDFISEDELNTLAELNTQIADATFLTKSNKFTKCIIIENLAAADDNMLFTSFFVAVTITDVWCNYNGSAPSTIAQISLEDGSDNAMTHTTPVCTAPGTPATVQSITVAGSLTAREVLRLDVDNAVSPETDTYNFCVAYTID